MLCIISNIVTMAIVYDDANHGYLSRLEKANLFFTFAFVLEAILKIISYGIFYLLKII